MAQKTKTRLMMVEREKIKKANAKRARERKERKMSGKDGDGKDEEEQGVDHEKGEEKQGRKTVKNKMDRVRRGVARIAILGNVQLAHPP